MTFGAAHMRSDGGIWYNLRSSVREIVPFPGGVMVFEKGRRVQDVGCRPGV